MVEATASPGVDLERLEAVIDEELAALRAKGVTEDELTLAQVGFEGRFLRNLQRVGGLGRQAPMSSTTTTPSRRSGAPPWDLDRHRAVTPAAIQRYAAEYLDSQQRAVLQVVPAREAVAAAAGRARRGAARGRVRLSSLRRRRPCSAPLWTAASKLYLVEKHELPLVQVTLNIKSGWAADPAERPGTAALTAALLDEGTSGRDALTIAEEARRLGARLSTESFFDGSRVSLNVLKRELNGGLALMSDLVLGASFPEEELERQRQRLLGQIQQDNSQPRVAAMTAHAEAALRRGPSLRPADDGHGHRGLARGASAARTCAPSTPLTTGPTMPPLSSWGTSPSRRRARSSTAPSASWQPGTVPAASIPAPQTAAGPRICLVDRPGAQQSLILLGQLGLERADPGYLPFEVMNAALGGSFIARINMNLREDKGYTYGSYSFLQGFKAAGAFGCSAPVHTQYTGAALGELLREIGDIRGARPIAEQEFTDCKHRLVQGYPARFETLEGIAGQLSDLLVNELPLSEWSDYVARVQAIDRATANRSAREQLDPEAMQIVIVGDRAAVLPQLAELGLTDVLEVKPDEL